MKYEEQLATKEQEKLREQIRLLSQKLGDNAYDVRKTIFGKVATVIDAAFSDPEQRKSVKDLVSDSIFGTNIWDNNSYLFEQFAEAQGFKLWNDALPQNETVASAYSPINIFDKV